MANPPGMKIKLVTPDGRKRTYTLSVKFETMVEIEERTGQCLFALARGLAKGEVGCVDAATIVSAGLKASGETVSEEEIGEMILRTGLAEVLLSVGDFLVKMIGGSKTAGKSKAPVRP